MAPESNRPQKRMRPNVDASKLSMKDFEKMVKDRDFGMTIAELVVDNSPKWVGYPKRGKAIITSVGRSGASPYASDKGQSVYTVIPLDKDSVVGICPSFDFLDGADDGDPITELNIFSAWIREWTGVVIGGYNDLVRAFSIMDKNKNSIIKEAGHEIPVIEWWAGTNKKFLSYIQDISTPAGFRKSKYWSQGVKGDGNEAWLDCSCLLVRNLDDVDFEEVQ